MHVEQVTEEQSYALLEYVCHLIAKDYTATLGDLIVLGEGVVLTALATVLYADYEVSMSKATFPKYVHFPERRCGETRSPTTIEGSTPQPRQ